MLTVMQLFLVRPILYSISLTFKFQFAVVLLARPVAVAEKIPWNLDHKISLDFARVLQTIMKLCMTTRFF